MDLIPFIMVIISVFTHAYWNYLVKRSGNKHIFTALSKLAEVVIFAVPGMYFISIVPITLDFFWLIGVAAFFVFLNYYFLSIAYSKGDFTLVYPISRSSMLFIPLIASIAIGETLNYVGYIALVLIMVGTLLIHIDRFSIDSFRELTQKMNNKGTLFALLGALTVACYTIWDKVSISKTNPFLYFYMYTILVAIFYNSGNFFRFGFTAVRMEFLSNYRLIIVVGFLNSITYLLILNALLVSKASYVGGLRQLSIVVGVLLGYRFLKEKVESPQVIGLILSILGSLAVYFAD